MEAFRDGELLWRERMSTSTRVTGWLGVALGLVGAGVGVARGAPVVVVVGVLLIAFSLVGSLLPVVEARSTGIYVRNVLREVWVPWAAVVTIVPNTRVNVILDGGQVVGVWAVQPGGASYLGARSRIDVVAERLRDAWNEVGTGQGPGVVVRRLARPWPG